MMGLQEEPAIKDKPDAYPLVFKGGSIEFDNVHFGYSSMSLLRIYLFISAENVSMRIEKRHCLLLLLATAHQVLD